MVAANRAVSASDQGHDILRLRRQHVQGVRAGYQVNTCGNHGRGMDQRRDRGRAGHRVGQPHVQRQLS